jgi:hypothetical protein
MKRLLAVALSFFFAQSAMAAKIPPVYLEKLDKIPDLMQSLPEAGLPGKGAAYCGPVAISNSVVWMQKNGFEKIADFENWSPRNQGALALLLSRSKYMGTTESEGTGARGIMTGLSRYLTDRKIGPFQILYQGWDRHPKRFSTGEKRPNLDWIKESILGRSTVWLKIGKTATGDLRGIG